MLQALTSVNSRCGPSGLAFRKASVVRRPPRARAYSVLMFQGGDSGDKQQQDGRSDAAGGTATASHADVEADLRQEVNFLKEKVQEMQAQLEQLNDRARRRAISLAEAVRSAGHGDPEQIEQLQHQHDEQLEQDEKAWEGVLENFTQLMSKGYIQSTEKIRDRLLLSEWELSRKQVAMRRGISQFEMQCAEQKVALPYELITELYEEPDNLGIIKDPHLRMQARASINQALDEEYLKAWAHCTSEAQKLAEQFSQSEFISKFIPKDSVIEGLKRVVPMAVKKLVL